MRFLTSEQIRFFEEEGYLHVPGVFSCEEVESFRKGCRQKVPGDTAGRSEFRNATLSPKMVAIMKDLLGERLIYPGLSQTRTQDYPARFGSRFFHEDTAGDDGDFSKSYPIVNTGIYLQDHVQYSGTLKIMPGSHRRPCNTSKTVFGAVKNIIKCLLKLNFKEAWEVLNLRRSVNIPSMPGDVIIWNVRTHHSGYAVRLKAFPNLSLPPVIENWVPSFLRRPDHPDRDVILSIYAAPSPYLEEYISIQIRKGFRKQHYLNSLLETEPVQKVARDQGVELRNDGYHYAKDPDNRFSTQAEYS